jgi:GTP pyrophosphokinase
MVKVREITRDVEASDWLEALTSRLSPADRALIAHVDAWVTENYAGQVHPDGTSLVEHARGAAGVLAGLRVDGDAIAAILLLGAPVGSAVRSSRWWMAC